MNENREEPKNPIAQNTPDWMRKCDQQRMDSTEEQRRFHEFIVYLRNDAADNLPTASPECLSTIEHQRPSIPQPKGIVLKADCGYSYYQTENQKHKAIESIKEPHPTPTLFESIMSYFKLAIKV